MVSYHSRLQLGDCSCLNHWKSLTWSNMFFLSKPQSTCYCFTLSSLPNSVLVRSPNLTSEQCSIIGPDRAKQWNVVFVVWWILIWCDAKNIWLSSTLWHKVDYYTALIFNVHPLMFFMKTTLTGKGMMIVEFVIFLKSTFSLPTKSSCLISIFWSAKSR